MKHLKISCQKHKISSLLLSSRCMGEELDKFLDYVLILLYCVNMYVCREFK